MPSLTEAQIGVSVSLQLNYANIDLIYKLLDIDNVMLYLSGLNEDRNEVKMILCIDDEEGFESFFELIELESNEEFKKKYEELKLHDNLIFHFIYVCAGINVFDIQYRNSAVFQNDEHGMTPANFIERIQNGIKIFKDVGVSEELIKVGNTMYDNYD
jgi:hypothetical protein